MTDTSYTSSHDKTVIKFISQTTIIIIRIIILLIMFPFYYRDMHIS